ncbi:hypothetical protein B0O99DRAFT_738770 [Bisporella sp. PMI_857]|nr:hypothetical protein B0O99DRAFT_738770 [Bisporella sp. PMI_857]
MQILDNNDDLDKARARGQAEGASVKSIPGVLNWTRSIDTSDPWYDVKEGRHIEEIAPGLGSHEQHSVPSTPAQAQPLQDQTHQQGIGSITRSTSVGSALYSLPSPDSGDDGWTDENMAELEKELGLALEEEQVPEGEIQSREYSETTSGRPEKLQDVSRHGAAQDLEEWEQRETQVVVETLGGRELGEEELVGEAGMVEMQQQEELAGQNNELGRPALGDQQNLVEQRNPRSLRSTSTVFDCVGYEPGNFLDARQKQPSTESYGGISKQVGFLVQRRRRTNVNATAAFRTILLKLGPTGGNGHFPSSRDAL